MSRAGPQRRPVSLVAGAQLLLRPLQLAGVYLGLLLRLDGSRDAELQPGRAAIVVMVASVLVTMFYHCQQSWTLGTLLVSSPLLSAANDSRFAMRMYRGLELGSMVSHLCLAGLVLLERRRLARLTVSRLYLVERPLQRLLGRRSYAIFAFKTLAINCALGCIMYTSRNSWSNSLYLLAVFNLYLSNVHGPLMFICYLSRALGEHVRGFSALNVDSLFRLAAQPAEGPQKAPPTGPATRLARLWALLASRRYAHTGRQLEMARIARASRLLSSCERSSNELALRRKLCMAQRMVARLTEASRALNRPAWPFLVTAATLDLLATAFMVVLAYRGRHHLVELCCGLMMGSLSLFAWHVCVSFDELRAQLRTMNNKLFDFIIFNAAPNSAADEHLWAQFQMLRKMSDSIHFRVAGVVPVTRRLLLVVLGHLLSFVFLSIEVMHVVDEPAAAAARARQGPKQGPEDT